MTGTSWLQTGLALVLVIGLVLMAGGLFKRLAGPRRARDLAVLSQASLGQRERVVVVAWDGQEWMLGVGPGQVNLIAHRDAAPAPADAATAPDAARQAPDAAPPSGTPPSLPQAFALQLQHTLARWSRP